MNDKAVDRIAAAMERIADSIEAALPHTKYVDLTYLAREIGVSRKWLKEETNAGRIPAIGGASKHYSVAAVVKAMDANAEAQLRPSASAD
ncbi:MAG: hypothetical protein IIC06_07020 [Proteobacteria bacterium]|nr:hypothetical protein [Pseudomonadota bacterium]